MCVDMLVQLSPASKTDLVMHVLLKRAADRVGGTRRKVEPVHIVWCELPLSARENSRRVRNQNCFNLLVRYAVASQTRHEILEDVAVTVAAKTRQHDLHEHVLRHEDPVNKSGIDQRLDRAGVFFIGG